MTRHTNVLRDLPTTAWSLTQFVALLVRAAMTPHLLLDVVRVRAVLVVLTAAGLLTGRRWTRRSRT